MPDLHPKSVNNYVHITILVGKHGNWDYSRNTLLKSGSQWHLGVCQVDKIEQNAGQIRELINH